MQRAEKQFTGGIKESAEFTREAAVVWKGLPAVEKQVYEDAYANAIGEWQERKKAHAAENGAGAGTSESEDKP